LAVIFEIVFIKMQAVQTYIQQHKQRYLDELFDLLRIPSISADEQYAAEMQRMAAAVVAHLNKAGLDDARAHPTAGHPIVFAQKMVDAGLPTVLVYGHYDVQPPDPLDLWESDPFEPVIKKTPIHPDGAIFARGACDDKGQVFMHIKAVEAMLATDALSCNVKFILEGEEEVGSKNLHPFVQANRERLACDVVLVSDTSIIANDIPSLTVSLRGLAYMEVFVTGPNRDLHSGVYGGAVANPVHILCELIARLHDENNHITIPGFYDKVVELSPEQRQKLNEAPYNEAKYKADLAVDALLGETGFNTLERVGIRPTLEVNGIRGGYIGEGAKTVLPSKASAKISMRLVPNQDPDEIAQLFTEHLQKCAPAGVTLEVHKHSTGMYSRTPVDTVEYQAAEKAMQTSFQKPVIPTYEGGSIPIAPMFKAELNANTVFMGFGLNSDALHSPNEHYGLFNFYKGIETIPYFYQYYKELKQ
jgi:acetylornithine deacetylase/succinyl-diaminopimelate desuccinylase-like protein